MCHWIVTIDGSVQDCGISNALAMEISQFCTEPTICMIKLGVFNMPDDGLRDDYY